METKLTLTPDQIGLLRDSLFRDAWHGDKGRRDEAPEADLLLFVESCNQSGLNPFTRQIYPMYRNQNIGTKEQPVWIRKLSIQATIDGFRLIAERSGKYQGQGGPFFCGPDGQWTEVWTKGVQQPPHAAKVECYVRDFQKPIFSVALWEEYCPTRQGADRMWKERPTGMLGKCAEALVLRKAFPNLFSGIYTREEMSKANEEGPEVVPPSAAKPPAIHPPTAPAVVKPGPTVAPPRVTDDELPESFGGKQETVPESEKRIEPVTDCRDAMRSFFARYKECELTEIEAKALAYETTGKDSTTKFDKREWEDVHRQLDCRRDWLVYCEQDRGIQAGQAQELAETISGAPWTKPWGPAWKKLQDEMAKKQPPDPNAGMTRQMILSRDAALALVDIRSYAGSVMPGENSAKWGQSEWDRAFLGVSTRKEWLEACKKYKRMNEDEARAWAAELGVEWNAVCAPNVLAALRQVMTNMAKEG